MTEPLQKPQGKKLDPLGLRFDEEIIKRLEKCADRLRQTKTALGQQAVIALVEAIEKANYRLVIPIEMAVAYVPTLATRKVERIFQEEEPVEQRSRFLAPGADAGF